MTVIVCKTSKSTYKIRKNGIFIGMHHDKQVLYSVQTLYLQGFAGILKKACNKHRKTVDNSYKLLYTVCGWKGETGNPVIRNKRTGRQATGISAGSRRDWLKKEEG